MSGKNCVVARRPFWSVILLLQLILTNGCGSSSRVAFASSDTQEAEVFLERVESDWNEIRLMSSPEYLLERSDSVDPKKVLEKITEIQNRTMKGFEKLLEERKFSESQYNRYLEILKRGSSQ